MKTLAVFYVSLCVSHLYCASSDSTEEGMAEEAALAVLPNRSQFFQYESVSLSCGQQGKSPEWRVMRNTTRNKSQPCFILRDILNESQCLIDDLYPSDSGVYWCESAAGRCSDAIWITVTAGPVVLESPALPVTQGDDVSLTCRTRTTSSSSSSLTAHFYKDGLLIGSSSTGHTTIRRVSKADEGLYKCSTSGGAESPDSRLTVRESNSVKSPTETPLHPRNLQTPPPSTETRVQVAADLLPGRSRLAVGLAVVFVFLVLGGGVGGCLLRRSSQQAKVPEKPLPPPEANGF